MSSQARPDTATPSDSPEAAHLREELRSATRAREVLLASVAHDLRNPLNTFAMSTGLLRDDLERNEVDPARALSLIARMDRATHRMQSLIEDLLEASRIEARKIELLPRVELAAPIVREALAAARPIATDRGTNLVLMDLDESAKVEIDRARSVQALGKLVAFSLKATGEGGVIGLGVDRSKAAPDRVVFIVRSIPPTGSTTAPHDEGRGGLSLFIGRGLFGLMGGELAIEQSPGGPQITVTLPAAT